MSNDLLNNGHFGFDGLPTMTVNLMSVHLMTARLTIYC